MYFSVVSMAEIYRQIISDIADGHPDELGELLLKARKYEIENRAPVPLEKMEEFAQLAGVDKPYRAYFGFLRRFLFLEKYADGNNPLLCAYFTSFEEDGALQYVLDRALLERKEINEIPDVDPFDMRHKATDIMKLTLVTD